VIAGAELRADRPERSQDLRPQPWQGGTQDHAASKPSVGRADDDQASADIVSQCLSFLARHLLATGTSYDAIALIDPDLNAF
jgi:hypothetical protein